MRIPAVIALLAVLQAPRALPAVVIETVSIGDAGNLADPETNRGAVSNIFEIGKFEVTNGQYVEFLNAVDPTGADIRDLFNSSSVNAERRGIVYDLFAPDGSKYSTKANFANKPVNYVSWYDAARFVNWLHNGQGSGDTEDGVYDMSLPEDAIVRKAGALFFLPTLDEWFKAAYYDPSLSGPDEDYWLFATRSDTAPVVATAGAGGDITNPGSNVANYNRGAMWNSVEGNVTTVGSAGTESTSFYGTFDQSGNVEEWTELGVGGNRETFGGYWGDLSVSLRSDEPIAPTSASNENADFGFRIAVAVPPLPGDGNGDGWVNGLDYLLWAGNYLEHPGPDGDISDGDYNDDGWVNGLDYLLWAGEYGNHATTTVPEPGSFVMLVVACLLALVRWRP